MKYTFLALALGTSSALCAGIEETRQLLKNLTAVQNEIGTSRVYINSREALEMRTRRIHLERDAGKRLSEALEQGKELVNKLNGKGLFAKPVDLKSPEGQKISAELDALTLEVGEIVTGLNNSSDDLRERWGLFVPKPWR